MHQLANALVLLMAHWPELLIQPSQEEGGWETGGTTWGIVSRNSSGIGIKRYFIEGGTQPKKHMRKCSNVTREAHTRIPTRYRFTYIHIGKKSKV